MTAAISRHRKRRKLKSEINVVPYIDVMLVLLIIFMVTAPLLTLSVDVKLPVANAKAVDSKEDPIVVIAYPDGRMGLLLPKSEIEVLDAAALQAKLAPIVAQQGGEIRVMVGAQGDAPYQTVLTAMDVLKRAKVTNVGLLTESGGNAR
ncbi:MAG TPA: ExbD/TolR family protein [Pseudoxanthomonas sp.]|nr:ExbD/TolR family protein [Pseudoxanthomonas sp.]